MNFYREASQHFSFWKHEPGKTKQTEDIMVFIKEIRKSSELNTTYNIQQQSNNIQPTRQLYAKNEDLEKKSRIDKDTCKCGKLMLCKFNLNCVTLCVPLFLVFYYLLWMVTVQFTRWTWRNYCIHFTNQDSLLLMS